MSDKDYLLAMAMQKMYDAENKGNLDRDRDETNFRRLDPTAPRHRHGGTNDDHLNETRNLVHPQWEFLDPTPDIFALFGAFDMKFFQHRLKCVSLEWSKKMYSCAGICYSRRNRIGMAVTIRLSEPLLKLRPRKDLVETLLHEMIHAYCFVLNIREGNGGHGPNFKKIMNGINKVAGTNITVYHNFHDEVEVYRQHWWRCNGACQNRSPFFGYVKRATNRAPGPYDSWWAGHKEACGGGFLKIKGPDLPGNSKKIKKSKKPKEDIRKFMNPKTERPNGAHNFTQGSSSSVSNITTLSSITGGVKGTIKSNGGGTMLLNPKTNPSAKNNFTQQQPASAVAAAFPPTSYPGLSSEPFSIMGTRSGAVVPAKGKHNNLSWQELENKPNLGQGYSLDSVSPKISDNSPGKRNSDDQDVRNRLRAIWSKRFGESGSKSNGDDKSSSETDDRDGGGFKRRRLATGDTDTNLNQPVIIIDDDEVNTGSNAPWTVLDDDLMYQDKKDEIIALSSDDSDDSDESNSGSVHGRPKSVPIKRLTQEERQNTIKQEILDESIGMGAGDIVLIDDEYIDSEAVLDEELPQNIINEFFGDDTLLHDFQLENDVRPWGMISLPNPENDIITCPICQNKMKRQGLSNHLDGCTGIAIRVPPSVHGAKKLPKSSRAAKPAKKISKPSRESIKEVLRKAGYAENELEKFLEDDDEPFNYSSSSSTSVIEVDETPPSIKSGKNGSSSSAITSTPIDISRSLNDVSPSTSAAARANLNNLNTSPISTAYENSRSYRQRNLLKTTRQCPNCGAEIEESHINEHLDDCLEKSPIKKRS